MSIFESVAAEIAKKVLERMTNRAPTEKANIPWSVDRLEPHLIEVANWSSRIELFGLAKAKATDSDTIRLFTSLPRKFRRDQRSTDIKSESFLMGGSGHHLLLGDPGAGKTTTIKRIARHLLLVPSRGSKANVQYPLVVRLREIESSARLEELLADAIGLSHERKRKDQLEAEAQIATKAPAAEQFKYDIVIGQKTCH